jgi:hypothetical protein
VKYHGFGDIVGFYENGNEYLFLWELQRGLLMFEQLCVFKIHLKGGIWLFDFSLCNFVRKYYRGRKLGSGFVQRWV